MHGKIFVKCATDLNEHKVTTTSENVPFLGHSTFSVMYVITGMQTVKQTIYPELENFAFLKTQASNTWIAHSLHVLNVSRLVQV